MQIKRTHQDDSSADTPDAEAQDETSTMQWTLWSLLKLALVTLACGFIAGEHPEHCWPGACPSRDTLCQGLRHP